MALVPALCDTCGTLFGSTNVFGGSGTATMIESKLGPCPNCGGWGSIPDGIYEFAGETLSIVSTWRPERVKRLVETLKEAKAQPDGRQAAERVLADEPELLNLANGS